MSFVLSRTHMKADKPQYALSVRRVLLPSWNMNIFYHCITSEKRCLCQVVCLSPTWSCPISLRDHSGTGYNGEHRNLALAGLSLPKKLATISYKQLLLSNTHTTTASFTATSNL